MACDGHGLASIIVVAVVAYCTVCEAAAAQKASVGSALRGWLGSDVVDSRSHDDFRASFVRSTDTSHKLRVCNAYPSATHVNVHRAGALLTQPGLPYKSCRDIDVQLQADDRLEFQFDGNTESSGAFLVTELPSFDAILMLVVYRHDKTSTAVAFESHVFANLANAQIAVLDTYRGAATGTLRIEDIKGAVANRAEELRFNSVVAVNPGMYAVTLGESNKTLAQQQLVALNRESYVILRCGVDSQDFGATYPVELIVFPNSDPKALGAARRFAARTTAWFLLAVSVALGTI